MINTIKLYYSKFTPNLFWSFASKAVAAVAFILIDILLARNLEIELYGKWQQFFSLITLLLFLTYSGIPSATQAFVAKHLNKPELKHILIDSLVLQIVFSSIATGVVLLTRDQIAGLIDQPEFSRFLLLAAPFLFIGALEEYLKNVFVGIKKTQYHFYMNLLSFGLRLIILAIIVFFFLEIPVIIYGYSFAMFTSVLIGLLFFRKTYSKIPYLDFQKPRYIKNILLYSLPIALSLIIAHSIPELNIQILGKLTNHSEVAFLGVGKQLTSKLPQIALAVSMGVMPDFAQITSENRQNKKKRFNQILKLNLLLYSFISVGFILLSPILMPFVYGSSYTDAILPLQILIVNVFLGSLNIFLIQLLRYHGKASQIAGLMAVVFILNILFNILLVPKFGAIGSSLAITLAFLPFNIILFRNARKVFEE